MKRDQFTWYRSYYEALRTLPAKDFQIAVLAICAYALDEEVPDLSGVPNSVFTLIRPTLDSGRNKAANRLKKQKTNQEQTDNKPEQTRKEKEGEVLNAIEIDNKVTVDVIMEHDGNLYCYVPNGITMGKHVVVQTTDGVWR